MREVNLRGWMNEVEVGWMNVVDNILCAMDERSGEHLIRSGEHLILRINEVHNTL
jgi:hypothetical protein|uniref:Uncharacterized protein n=1 Tax=Picea sitchensis TaxID=3332 RepID=A0A6B9XQF9_PICSI|nr:hypothetical protein Q903MT_gene3811 [Picea sitchensis]